MYINRNVYILYSTAVFRANAVRDSISLGSVGKGENSISSLRLFSEKLTLTQYFYYVI